MVTLLADLLGEKKKKKKKHNGGFHGCFHPIFALVTLRPVGIFFYPLYSSIYIPVGGSLLLLLNLNRLNKIFVSLFYIIKKKKILKEARLPRNCNFKEKHEKRTLCWIPSLRGVLDHY